MKTCLSILFVSLCVLTATAANDPWTENGITYTPVNNNTVTVTAYNGSSGAVIIPDRVNGNNETYTVTTIGTSAFQNRTGLTSIDLPNTVTTIGANAFAGCTNLASVAFGASVMTIGASAFQNCSSLTSVNLPNTVTTIGANAFQNCADLTFVGLPGSITMIDDFTFDNCTNLTFITLPGSITAIKDYAFRNCSNLTDIYVEWTTPSTTTLSTDAFSGLTPGNITLHVPAGSTSAYNMTPWTTFHGISTGKAAPSLIVTQPTGKIAASGCVENLTLTSNVNWMVSGSTARVNVRPRQGSGNATLEITVLPNQTTRTLVSTFTVSSTRPYNTNISGGQIVHTFTLVQEPALLEVSLSSANVADTGGKTTFMVTSNVRWQASCPDSWATVSPLSGNQNGPFTVTAAPNPVAAPRTATITVFSGRLIRTVTLTQAAAPPSLTLTPTKVNVPASGGEIPLHISSSFNWEAVSPAPWLTLNPPSGRHDTTAILIVEPNTDTQRSATVTVRGGGFTRTVTVMQTAPAMTVSQPTVEIIPNGASISLAITSNVYWEAGTSASWLTLNPMSGSHNGRVVVTFAPNVAVDNVATPRTAEVTILGGGLTRTIALTQDAPVLTVTPASAEISSSGGTVPLAIASNIAWTTDFVPVRQTAAPSDARTTAALADTWAIAPLPEARAATPSPPAWLTVRPSTGLRDGVITVSADANPGPSRTAVLAIRGSGFVHTVTLTQPTDDPNATDSPADASQIRTYGGLLHVRTPHAERVEIYSPAGQLLYMMQKDAGTAVIRLNTLPRGLLIVRTAGGQTEKIVNGTQGQ
jgi:hypothetical protein